MHFFSLPKFGTFPCLERVFDLLRQLGVEQAKLSKRSIAVTGSNGKGSTAAFIHSLAVSHGLRAALFTSPHLYDFRERFRIGREVVGTDLLEASSKVVMDAIRDYTRLKPEQVFGAFEAMYLIAALMFHEQDCDICIFEAGIGGRFDPVRTANAGVSVVSSIDLEHTEILGETLQEICLDKSDISAPGGTIFYGENCLPYADLVCSHLQPFGTRPSFCGKDFFLEEVEETESGVHFKLVTEMRTIPVFSPLHGRFQANNSALALLAFSQWYATQGQELSGSSGEKGFLDCSWPGRLEKISEAPLTVIDVGHSPDAVRSALSGLQRTYPKQSWILVCGVSENKNREDILRELSPQFRTVLCTRAFHKGAPAEEIARSFSAIDPEKEYIVASSIEQAVSLSLTLARERGLGIYVAGGLFLAAEYAYTIRGGNALDLRFFG